jgi:hypothetical protein
MVALDQLLASRLLMETDRVIQGYRSLPATDAISRGGKQAAAPPGSANSIVARSRRVRTATKAEPLAAVLEPGPAPSIRTPQPKKVSTC